MKPKYYVEAYQPQRTSKGEYLCHSISIYAWLIR